MKKTFFKATLIFALSALTLTGCSGGSASENSQKQSSTIYAMDTVMNLDVYGNGAEDALSAAESELNRLDDLLSCQDENSEISALNAAAADPNTANAVEVGKEITDLLAAAKQYSAATDGAFDVTVAPIVALWNFTGDNPSVPSKTAIDALLPFVGSGSIACSGTAVSLPDGVSVDLGGIAKGYASDRLLDIWDDSGVGSAVVSLGGNVYVRGSNPDGDPWRVAVKNPDDPETYIGILSCSDTFVITSGGYQRYFEQDGVRYHHILDPKTGYSANSGLSSVTIVADAVSGNGTMCDALSTALFVLGEDKAIDFWRSGEYDFQMILVTDDGRILVTDGIADNFNASESGENYEIQTISADN